MAIKTVKELRAFLADKPDHALVLVQHDAASDLLPAEISSFHEGGDEPFIVISQES